MIHEQGGGCNEAREQPTGLRDASAAALEVAEAAILQRGKRCIVGREERVERHGEDIDDGRRGLAAPVEGAHLAQDVVGLGEVGDALWGEEGGESDDVVEGDRHAAARQRVPHVHRVAEDDEAWGFLDGGRQERVRHAAHLAVFERFLEGWPHASGERREHDVSHVVLYTAGCGRGRGEVLGYIDQDARLMGADLIDQDGRGVGQDDVAVIGARQLGVDELEAPELGAHLGLVLDVGLAELAGVAVGDERQGAEVVVALAVGLAFDAEDLVGVRALHHVGDGRLDDGYVGGGAGGGAQLADEAAVVEGATLWRVGGRCGVEEVGRVGDVDGFAVVDDLVAVAGYRVDVL